MTPDLPLSSRITSRAFRIASRRPCRFYDDHVVAIGLDGNQRHVDVVFLAAGELVEMAIERLELLELGLVGLHRLIELRGVLLEVVLPLQQHGDVVCFLFNLFSERADFDRVLRVLAQRSSSFRIRTISSAVRSISGECVACPPNSVGRG